jgi:hypothetical protein
MKEIWLNAMMESTTQKGCTMKKQRGIINSIIAIIVKKILIRTAM